MRLKTLNEIAVGIINRMHDKIPDIDTKEGTFIRDVFIDPPAYEIQSLYEEAKLIELAQSILTATENDLDRLGMNFFVMRKGASRSTGKVRFILGDKKPTKLITIPIGSRVFTPATDTREELYFETTESFEILPNSPNTYSFDSNNGFYYTDIPAWSIETGEAFNISAGEISELYEGINELIVGVTNPFGFSGGTDVEDDESLAFRISLAVTGSNIGTKDGYTSFIFKQDGVIDAKVISAGEPLMTRDNGMGGMVDIYVRAENLEEIEETFNVDLDYISDTSERPGYDDINLTKQPVVNVISITGIKNDANPDDPPISYINGSKYEIEQGTNKYFYDLEWNFNPPSNGGEKTLEEAADELLSTRLKAIDYLYDLKYNINYGIINPELDTIQPHDPYFFRGFYNDGLVYVLKSRQEVDNPYVGDRIFVKKNGVIYERNYVTPDFILMKDTSDYGGSIDGTDRIKWLSYSDGANRPTEGEILTLHYNFNETIGTLQNQIEDKRVLTADVLVKQARRVGIEIKVEAVLEPGYIEDEVRISIINQITNYINNLKQLGNGIDRSDIISIVRITSGVESVNVENVYLARVNEGPQKKLNIKGFEYFEIDRIVVTIQPEGTIV